MHNRIIGIASLFIALTSPGPLFAQTEPVYTLRINCGTPGVTISINGKSYNQKSVEQKLAAGSYSIKAEKADYKPYQRAVIVPQEKELFIRLNTLQSHYQFIKQIPTGRQPKDIIFSPDDRYLLITLLDDCGLNIYDRETDRISTIAAPSPYRAAKGFVEGVFNLTGSEFWFTQMDAKGRIFVLDMQTKTIIHVIEPVGNWTKVGEFSPDGSLYCVTNWLSNDVTVINTSTYKIIKTFKCSDGRAPRGVGFSGDGKYIYVVFFDSGQIMKFDVQQDYKLVSKIYTGGTNGRFRPDYEKKVAYINNMALNVFYVFDLQTEKITKQVKTWVNPNNLKLSPDKRYIYISNRGPNNPKDWLLRSPEDGRIQVFDTEQDFKIVEELEVGNQPIGIALTSDNKLLAISNFLDHNIELYSVSF